MKIDELPKEYLRLLELNMLRLEDLDARDIKSRLNHDNLMRCFRFSDTPEGKNFWFAVHYAETEKDLPPIPKPKSKTRS